MLLVIGIAVGVAVVGTFGFAGLIARRWPWQLVDAGVQLIDVVKLAFAVVAGVGGVVALVVAYRRQRILEVDEAGHRDQVRLLTERFGAAAQQLGDPSAAVRLAGVYAMAALADEWEEQRQQCVDVLCGYLRLPCADDALGDPEIRKTIVDVIRNHTNPNAEVSWSTYDFDLAGAHFCRAVFTGAVFDGQVNFTRSTFSDLAQFAQVRFGQSLSFDKVKFLDVAEFWETEFSGHVNFGSVMFQEVASFTRVTFGMGMFFRDAVFRKQFKFRKVRFAGRGLKNVFRTRCEGPVVIEDLELVGNRLQRLELEALDTFEFSCADGSEGGELTLIGGQLRQASSFQARSDESIRIWVTQTTFGQSVSMDGGDWVLCRADFSQVATVDLRPTKLAYSKASRFPGDFIVPEDWNLEEDDDLPGLWRS